LSTIIESGAARVLPPVHPGEYLREEFLLPLAITPYALAQRLNVPRTRIERIVREETGITPDTALRLARYFGTSPQFWLNLQGLFDLTLAESANSDEIAAIEPLPSADLSRKSA